MLLVSFDVGGTRGWGMALAPAPVAPAYRYGPPDMRRHSLLAAFDQAASNGPVLFILPPGPCHQADPPVPLPATQLGAYVPVGVVPPPPPVQPPTSVVNPGVGMVWSDGLPVQSGSTFVPPRYVMAYATLARYVIDLLFIFFPPMLAIYLPLSYHFRHAGDIPTAVSLPKRPTTLAIPPTLDAVDRGYVVAISSFGYLCLYCYIVPGVFL